LYTEGAHVVQYADDIQVAVSGRTGDVGSLVQLMEHNLALLSRWFGKNGIKINAKKLSSSFLAHGKTFSASQLSTLNLWTPTSPVPPLS